MNKQFRDRARAKIDEMDFARIEKHLNIDVIGSLDQISTLTAAHRLKLWRR